MQLQALFIKLPASKEKQFLGEIIRDASRCSTEARHSLWGLRAAGTAASLEFSDKLANLSRQAVQGKSISLSLKLQPVSLTMFPEIEYQLLRLAQEAISNTIAHANANDLEVRLSLQGRRLELALEDDGIGFDNNEQPPFGHFGLVGMRERAAEIGADLNVTTLRGGGTKVSVRLLLPEPASDGNLDTSLEHQIR